MPDDIEIRHDLRSGDLGHIVSLHGTVYEPLGGYGLRFEAFVGKTLADFILGNNLHGRVWLAERGERLVGCAAMVLRGSGRGQLRWVVVDPTERGRGLGKQLVNSALDYARHNDCNTVFLETTDGLPESQALYERLGFTVNSATVTKLWHGPRALIIMEADLA